MKQALVKLAIRDSALKFIYPTNEHKERDPTEYNEIRQYLTNLLNLCATSRDVYEVLPKPLLSILKPKQHTTESDIYFSNEFISFQQANTIAYAKLEKLLTIKLLTE